MSWQGDAQRGCAEAGLCGVRGTLSVRLPRSGSIDLTSQGGGIFESGFSADGSTSAVARVLRTASDGSTTACVDDLGGELDSGDPLGLDVVRGRVRLLLGGSERLVALDAGRCAGPLPSDVIPALPTADFPLSGLRRARTIDLRGDRTFSAGLFAGRLVSTVQVRLAPARRPSGDHGVFRGPLSHAVPVEALTLVYRVEAVSGALTVGFHGAGAPLCSALDACGLSGSVSYGIGGPAGGTAELDAGERRPASGARSAAAMLRRLRSGALRASGFVNLGGAGSATGESQWSGATGTCRDVAAGGPPEIELQTGRAGLTATLAPGSPPDGADPLRTRCPGPLLQDVAGQGPLARAEVSPVALAASRIVLRFARPGAFTNGAMTGSRAGEIVVELRRVAIRRHLGRGSGEFG